MAGLFERIIASGGRAFVDGDRDRASLTDALLVEGRRELVGSEPLVYDLTDVASLWWSSSEYGSYDVATIPQLALPGYCFFAEYGVPPRVRRHLKETGEMLRAGAAVLSAPEACGESAGLVGRLAIREVGRVGAVLFAPDPYDTPACEDGRGEYTGGIPAEESPPRAVAPGRLVHALIFFWEGPGSGGPTGPHLRYVIPLREDASPLASANIHLPPRGEGPVGALVGRYVERIGASLLGPVVFGLGLLACENVKTLWREGPFVSYRKPVLEGGPSEERSSVGGGGPPEAARGMGGGEPMQIAFDGGGFVSERGRLLWLRGADERVEGGY